MVLTTTAVSLTALEKDTVYCANKSLTEKCPSQ